MSCGVWPRPAFQGFEHQRVFVHDHPDWRAYGDPSVLGATLRWAFCNNFSTRPSRQRRPSHVSPALALSYKSTSRVPPTVREVVNQHPLIQVNERNCLGLSNRGVVRNSARSLLPKHAAVTAVWKHRAPSHVEPEGVQPMPKDRGTEQGDVECSSALEMAAAEARLGVPTEQAARTLLWMCAG